MPALDCPQTRPRRAFTLVEVAVALFVVGFGFSAVLAAFPVGVKWARRSAAQSLGSRLAVSYFNELCAQFAFTPASTGSGTNWSSPLPVGEIGWLESHNDARKGPLFFVGDVNGLTPFNGTLTTPRLRRNRLYERDGATLPPRYTGGFYLVAALNITSLFPNHHNMSTTYSSGQFSGTNDSVSTNDGDIYTDQTQALWASSDLSDPTLLNASHRLYDVYIYVYDSDPTEADTQDKLDKKLVATFRGRAWLGWQPPIS